MCPQKAKILIIEDEAVVALSLKMIALSYGYEVAGLATNYSDAIRIAEKSLPDLILADIKIKGDKDGIETARAIKEICGSSVIFISAYSNEETLGECMKLNPFAYLKKPFKDQELRNAIDGALKERDSINFGNEVLPSD